MVKARSLAILVSLAGCANIWGFDDLNPPPPPPPPLVCVGFVEPCPTGCTACSMRCVDTETDELNCGACGTQCTGGRACEKGACVCEEGTESCGGLCVDVSSDPMNCGGCAVACDTGGACNDGTCTFPSVLSTGQGVPGAIVADAARLYFGGGTSIYSMAKDGTDLVTLADAGSTVPIAIDADNLYYGGFSINRVPLTGGTPALLAMPATTAGALAVDATDVYWLETGSVNKVPIGGGSALVLTTMASVSSTTIALDADYVYFSYSYNVYRTPLTGGSITPLGMAPSTVTDIELDATSVFVAGGSVVALAIDGTTTQTLTSVSSPQKLAIDAENVYFFSAGSLSRVSKRGGDVTVLATDPYARDLTVDDTSVYWTSSGEDGVSGAVMTVAK